MAKKSNTTLILVGAIVLILVLSMGSSGGIPKIDLSNLNPFSSLGGTSGNLQDVDRKVSFSLVNDYAGSALTSKTLLVYDSDGTTLLETLTTDGTTGIVSSQNPYPSGKVLYVYYANTNDKQWFEVVVPKMPASEVESQTTNPVKLKSFAIGTYATDLLYQAATSISDSGNFNQTASSLTTPTFKYMLQNTGNDNTGLKDSYDPVYRQNLYVIMYVTFSGTGYENVIVNGFDGDFTLGSTHYVWKRLNAYELSKIKVGNNYLSEGDTAVTFSLDLTGYTGDGVTMQIEVKAYADPAYAYSHGGNFGTKSYEIAEQTVTLYEGD